MGSPTIGGGGGGVKLGLIFEKLLQFIIEKCLSRDPSLFVLGLLLRDCCVVSCRAVLFFPLQFPVSILGYLLLPSSPIGLTQWEFIAVNIVGGFIYSYAKIKVCVVFIFFFFRNSRLCDTLVLLLYCCCI